MTKRLLKKAGNSRTVYLFVNQYRANDRPVKFKNQGDDDA